jgi:basic membrane protein A
MKKPDFAVYGTIEDFLKGRFTPGVKLYDLSNNGVEIAPFHEQSENVPLKLAQLVKTTKGKILSGEVDLFETCRSIEGSGRFTVGRPVFISPFSWLVS